METGPNWLSLGGNLKTQERDSGRSEDQQCDFVLSGGQCYAFKASVAWLRSTSPPLGNNLVCLKPPSHVVQK